MCLFHFREGVEGVFPTHTGGSKANSSSPQATMFCVIMKINFKPASEATPPLTLVIAAYSWFKSAPDGALILPPGPPS